MELKYVMVDGLAPVIFFSSIEHKQMRGLGQITSAGFIRLKPSPDGGLAVETYGHSHGLDLGPQPDDAAIIRMIILKSSQEERH